MDDLRGLLGIRRMARIPNARIRELCEVTMRVDEIIDEDVLRPVVRQCGEDGE